jgi:accessory Sec system glycosyltransferase GtfB
MINLFEHYDQASADLLRSQVIAKLKIPSVAMFDNGFLPQEVDSPIQHYCDFNRNQQPLYFDKLPLPRYWKIKSKANSGEVYDLNQKRADLIYSSNDNSRSIKEVHWLNPDGSISWVDHYNRYGAMFAKTYYENGREAFVKYFDQKGKQVMAWNCISGDFWLEGSYERHFTSREAFMAYYLQQSHYKLDHVLYNTLNRSMMVTLQLPKNGSESDILFWHERTSNKLPGNMQYLIDNQTRTKHIVFQNYLDWQNRNQFLPKHTDNVDFQYLGIVYPHPRGNSLQQRALILTNSDQIEQLDTLVKLLPNLEFNIAAVTEMSGKLLSFGDLKNVNVYPTVSRGRLKELMAKCDIYFDINYGNEILDAVRGAFEQNMLILGFEDTLHDRQFVAPENIFTKGEADKMAQVTLKALVKPQEMKRLVDEQRKLAGDVLAADYQRAFGEWK